MRNRIRICAVHELEPGVRRIVEIDDHEEALVVNLSGTVYAISNICPHEGAALQHGDIEGTVLYCPLHLWGFEFTTGAYVEDARICARIYTVIERDHQLFLLLP